MLFGLGRAIEFLEDQMNRAEDKFVSIIESVGIYYLFFRRSTKEKVIEKWNRNPIRSWGTHFNLMKSFDKRLSIFLLIMMEATYC